MASQSPPLSNTNGHISRKKTSSPPKNPLPPGWERVKSDQGAYYYWDKKSGKTSWKFPEEEGMMLCVYVRVCACVCMCMAATMQCMCIHVCNWIGTISTRTAALTNDLHAQLVCVWARSIARERGGKHPIVKHWKPFSYLWSTEELYCSLVLDLHGHCTIV